jgi:orotate phosphoribosyltransferase
MPFLTELPKASTMPIIDINALPMGERLPGWKDHTFSRASMTFARFDFAAGERVPDLASRSIVTSSNRSAQQDGVLELFLARHGHFRFESGHHGDLWLEIAPAYIHPNRLRPFAVELARLLAAHQIEAVCGPLVECAFLAQMVAEELGSEFYFAEQFARPSSEGLYPVGYRIPASLRSRMLGKRTAIVDDVINAGSAVRGATEDLQSCGARLVAIGALLTLGSPASSFAANQGVPLETLSHISKNALWAPSSCPMCASGVPLEGIGGPSS